MSSPRAFVRGKKPDVFSTGDTKPRVITTADRVRVLEAALSGLSWQAVASLTGVDRWTVEGIATAAGWGRQALVEANLARLKGAA